MANEIIALKSNPAGNEITALMVFPLDAGKIKQVGGANVVPTPSSGLSGTEAALVDASHQAALDDGTSVYRRVRFPIQDDDTGSSLANKARQRYGELLPVVQNAYDKTYRFVGAELDAPG